VLQSCQQRRGGKDPDPDRGQLDRQRQTVEATTNLGHRRRVLLREHESGPDLGRSLQEESHGCHPRETLPHRPCATDRAGDSQRRDGDVDLTAEV
jgi:hypothetical protein